ncbi:MAG: hypothetical protein DLM55_03785 [Acidimicrobiales bacterium]|nr:MAG: hypothetical protein DLM55_03785 [Acidimicrobiales bacterium]
MTGLRKLLGLDSAAGPEELRAAIAQRRRSLRRRVISPDLAVRQEAERAMQQLDDAERGNLTETVKPQSGVRDKNSPVSPDSPKLVGPISHGRISSAASKRQDRDDNPISRAVEQMQRGQHGVAVFTARRAVADDPDNSYAWSVLAQAASASSDHATALDAIERALHVDPEDAQLHAQRGAMLHTAAEPAKALAAYQAAASLQDDEPEYQVGIIEQLLAIGEVDRAVAHAQQAYRQSPDEEVLRTALARALGRRANLAQHELADGRLLITTAEQARQVQSLAERGLSVQPSEPTVYAELQRHRDYARKALRSRFSLAALKANYRWPLGLGFIAIAAMCCVPGALARDTDLLTRATILLGTVGGLALFGVALLRGCFQPQYARNAVLIEQSEPRRMGRPAQPLHVNVGAHAQ